MNDCDSCEKQVERVPPVNLSSSLLPQLVPEFQRKLLKLPAAFEVQQDLQLLGWPTLYLHDNWYYITMGAYPTASTPPAPTSTPPPHPPTDPPTKRNVA